VHISELAQHHVENPREVVSQGDVVNVKIIEVDADRRRLSLSLKRVDDSDEVQPRADGQPLETPAPPQIDLSEDVFPEGETPEAQPPVRDSGPGEGVSVEPEAQPPVRESGPGEGAPGEPGDSPEQEVEQRTGEEATDEALAETPVAEPEPAAEPPAEEADASIEADAVDPTHQGPGDSEGHAPYAPEEAEEKQE
jgi:small subunit ribosomal protein S1